MPTHQDRPIDNKPVFTRPHSTGSSFSQDQNTMAALAYFGFFVTGIFLLLTEKTNSFIRFHAMQSILLSLALFLIFTGLSSFAYVPFLGSAVNMFIIPVLTFGSFGIWAAAMYKAFQGEWYELPIIGPLARTKT